MRIRVTWVGRTKEKFIIEGTQKYLRLLKPYAEVVITEVREEKGSDIRSAMEKEGARISKLGVPYVLLDERGKDFTSPEFAGFIEKRSSGVNFLIGGPYGVSDAIREGADETIALSKMTLTHEMARLLLLEQVYRAFTIIRKRGYHH
jgi:23S rRNA (pseudouridine1915-N3)-methyltransferase